MSDAVTRILVFSDDWGRHPSSCQHLVRHLLPRFPVLWVNTIGTRPPRLDRLTLSRGLEKLAAWSSRRPAPAKAGGGPRVIAPIHWPSFRGSASRRLNAALLRRALRRELGRGLRSEPPGGLRTIALTTLPIVADLPGSIDVERWVYYCVDDLAAWPGLDRPPLERMERELVARVDAVVAVSEVLVERMAALGREASLLTHGVDLGHWRRASGPPPAAIEGLERPLVVFWGVVDRRLDAGWLERLAGRLSRGTVVLVGPPNNPDPRLDRLPRLARTGPLPYEELPALAREAAVFVLPYADMPATRALQPLKLKEYLATGKPVVTSPLPAVDDWRDACTVAGDAESFADAVLAHLAGGLPDGQLAARRGLEAESWEVKARALERVLLGAEG